MFYLEYKRGLTKATWENSGDMGEGGGGQLIFLYTLMGFFFLRADASSQIDRFRSAGDRVPRRVQRMVRHETEKNEQSRNQT